MNYLYLLLGVFVTVMNGAMAAPVCSVRAGNNGAPALVIDKQTFPPIFFAYGSSTPNNKVLDTIRMARAANINLVSFPISLDWHASDEVAAKIVEEVCAANPDVYFYLRIWLGPDTEWLAAHPDNCIAQADGSRLAYASVTSDAWREDAAKRLRRRLRTIIDGPRGDRFIGVALAYLNNGEWVFPASKGYLDYSPVNRKAYRAWLQKTYRTDKKLRIAWAQNNVSIESAEPPKQEERETPQQGPLRDPAQQAHLIDFLRFQHESVADTIGYFAHVVKQETGRKTLVGAFYGDTFELPGNGPRALQQSGHLALGRLLACPDVDIIHAPYSYFERGMGQPGHFPLPVDSAALHGKLVMMEDDTFTHLSPLPPAGESSPGYRERAQAPGETLALARRNAGNALMHRAGFGFVDLFGSGCWADKAFWDSAVLLRRMAAEMRSEPPFRPQIAVIVDEQAALLPTENDSLLVTSLSQWRSEFDRLGAPVGYYLQSDFDRLPDTVKVVILPTPYALSKADFLRIDRFLKRGMTVVWTYAPGVAGQDGLDWGRVAEVTGIAVEPRTDSVPMHIMSVPVPGEMNLKQTTCTPRMVVTDKEALSLAKYADSGEVCAAAKPWRGGTSVYTASPRLPVALLRWICQRSGVFLYRDTPGPLAVAGSYLIVNTKNAEPMAFHWPNPLHSADRIVPALPSPLSIKENAFSDNVPAQTTAIYVCE